MPKDPIVEGTDIVSAIMFIASDKLQLAPFVGRLLCAKHFKALFIGFGPRRLDGLKRCCGDRG